MRITKEIDLSRFEFWKGAEELAEYLTTNELNHIGEQLEELYPNGS
jgi:hypothetical protein